MNDSEIATYGNSEKKELTGITVKDIIGRPSQYSEPTDRLMTIALGDIDGLAMMTRVSQPPAIMWTEREITLLSPNRTTFVIFKPEIEPGAKALFEPEGKKEKGGYFMPSYEVWEGECKPIQFSKKDLLSFIKLYALECPQEIEGAIKNIKMRQTKVESETISLDDESQKSVVEENMQTNIPKRFKLMMRITRDFSCEVDFAASVVEGKDEWERKKGKQIELRVMNYRQVLRASMENYLAALPAEIPKIYGSMRLGDAPRESRY